MRLLSAVGSCLLLFAVAVPGHSQESAAHRAQVSRDITEMQHYTLTMDIVRRLGQTTRALAELSKTEPAVSDDKDSEGSQQTLDQLSAKFSRSPKAVAVMSAHGFTPRQFALAQFTLVQCSLAVAMLDAGSKPDDVVGAGQANPANLRLIREHRAEIEAINAGN